MEGLHLVKAYKEKGEYNLAIEELQKIIAEEPLNEEAHIALGLIYHERKDYDLALRGFETALLINPSNSNIFTLKGSVYDLLENYELAEREFKRAIERKAPNRADAHYALGKYYEKQNRYDEAIREYEEALKIEFKKEVSLRLVGLFRFLEREDMVEKRVLDDLGAISGGDRFFRNILLNELEMAQKKIVLSSKIRSFTLTLTNRCNLNCFACEAKRYTWEMPRKIIDEIMGFLPYLEYIMWQGGEVFLVNYFEEILEEARNYPNLKQLIVTNGMLLSEGLIEKLVVLPDVVLTLSVDGATREVYESIRRGAKFSKLIENIKQINLLRKRYNSNLRLHLNVTVMRSNYHQLLDLIEFAREYEFRSVLLRPVQGNLDNEENIFIKKDEGALNFIGQMMNELNDRAHKYRIWLDNRIPVHSPHHEERSKGEGEGIKKRKLLCYAPWQRLYISWDGNVYPDCMCIWPRDAGIGNVKRESLKDIWNNLGMQTYRKRLIENDYRGICSDDCISGNVPERYLKFNR